MDILGICSWLPAKELSLERIEEMVLSLSNGKSNNDNYSLKMELPINANENENVIRCSKDFIREGRRVYYLLMNDEVIVAVGYQ